MEIISKLSVIEITFQPIENHEIDTITERLLTIDFTIKTTHISYNQSKTSVVILGEDLSLIEFFSIPYNYVTTEYICMIFGGNIYGYHICDNRQFLLRKILVRWS